MKDLERQIDELADDESCKRYKESHTYGDTSHEERGAFCRGAQFGSSAILRLLAAPGEGHSPRRFILVKSVEMNCAVAESYLSDNWNRQPKEEYAPLTELLQARASERAAEVTATIRAAQMLKELTAEKAARLAAEERVRVLTEELECWLLSPEVFESYKNDPDEKCVYGWQLSKWRRTREALAKGRQS